LLVLLLVTLVLFALFLGGGLVAQGYLYQQPADRFPLRALAGALLVGSFIAAWVGIDKRWPRKYDTLFEFAPYERREFGDFEAIRWVSPNGSTLKVDAAGNPVETVVKFKRGVGAKADRFFEEGTEIPFQLNSTTKAGESYMTSAIRAKPDPNAQDMVRFNAETKTEKRTGMKTYTPDRKFVEEKGSRYILADQIGVVYVPSPWTVVLALFINLMLFVVWYAAFWPILQFTRGHAFALTVLFGLVTMFLLMPILFKPNRAPRNPFEAPRAFEMRPQPRAVSGRA
jgi:hypothetical protein